MFGNGRESRWSVPLGHLFFWHWPLSWLSDSSIGLMPVAIPTIISSVATSAPVGNCGVPCEQIRDEQWCTLKTFAERSWKHCILNAMWRVWGLRLLSWTPLVRKSNYLTSDIQYRPSMWSWISTKSTKSNFFRSWPPGITWRSCCEK